MGTDKALVQVGGHRLVEVSTKALHNAGAAEVFVVGGDEASLSRLGLAYVGDTYPGEGPLGGVITALGHARSEIVVVLACDHTNTSPVGVQAVVAALGDADVAIPASDGRPQVLHAAWRKSVRDHLRARFSDGARSIRQGIEGLEAAAVPDIDPAWFRDADRPTDLPQDAVRDWESGA